MSVDLFYAWHRNRFNERLLNETVEKGNRPELDVSDDEFVPRPQVVASREIGQGIIYVNVLDPEEFGEAFEKALNSVFEEHISFTKQMVWKILDTSSNSKWEKALDAFQCAAKQNMETHRLFFMIMLADWLTNIKKYAKDNADSRKYVAAFVSSERCSSKNGM
ncbi:7482_t:CDS:2 [Paraglomus brasilianum]|uniref:7482_t:CDS:1 n=1 Tax=Paraglomus brasilianum TaxID=144538 RepID=A0A9N8Z087_9GLOM|nr:7482_t:CDS:2 [Paraglomus brasilianum]